MIFIFHYCSIIDLREKNSSLYSGQDLAKAYENFTNEKIKKKDIYYLLGLSKNTFNKNFEGFLIKNGFIGRKSFSVTETYGILEFWQGEARWLRWEAFSKKELGEILNLSYKELSNELKFILDEKIEYKSFDKFPPSLIIQFFKHIDFDERNFNELV